MITTIRPAVLEDVPALVEMARRFLGSVYRGRLSDDPAFLEGLAHQLLTLPGRTILVAERGEGLIGMIGMMVYPHPMSGDAMASEVCWWVEPQHRGVGMRLLKAAETWARAAGATTLQMVAPNPEVERFYQRVGFAQVETVYQRSLS